MRSARFVMLVLLGLLAAPATAFGQLLIDPLPGALAPGAAEVHIGLTQFSWDPVPGRDLAITVVGHPRGHPRTGQRRRVFVRFQSPRQRCAGSYAQDRGTIVGPLIRHFHGPPPKVLPTDPHGMLGAIDSAGNVVVSTDTLDDEHFYRWKRRQTVRFCVWLGRRMSTRIRPVTQLIRLGAPMFAASVVADGSFGDSPGFQGFTWGSLATFRFREVDSAASPDPYCADEWPLGTFNATRGRVYYSGKGAGLSYGNPCSPPATFSWSYSALTPDGGSRPLGSISYVMAAQPSPTGHVGDCLLSPPIGATVLQAAAYLQAVGCRPGRTIARLDSGGSGSPSGFVFGFDIHGGDASIAPSGSVVDIAVYP